jgi:hypothetical protein
MSATIKKSRPWTHEQWLIALALGGLVLLALVLLVVDSTRRPPQAEPRMGPSKSDRSSLP